MALLGPSSCQLPLSPCWGGLSSIRFSEYGGAWAGSGEVGLFGVAPRLLCKVASPVKHNCLLFGCLDFSLNMLLA